MSGDNKMLKGAAIGALVGAAVTLFDSETRQNTKENIKNCSGKVWHSVKNPTETIEKVSSSISKINKQIQSVKDDALYVIEKVNEVSNSVEKNKKNEETYTTQQVVPLKVEE